MNTLKNITIFDSLVFLLCVVFAILVQSKMIPENNNRDKIFIALMISSVIFILGNVAPKIPYNRYTGLRLPWTITNEHAWIVAHRVLGYLSLPLGIIYIAGVAAGIDFELLTLVVIIIWIGVPGILSYISRYK